MDFFTKVSTIIAALFTAAFSLFMYRKKNQDGLQKDVNDLKVHSSGLTVLVQTIHEDVKEIKDLLQRQKRR